MGSLFTGEPLTATSYASSTSETPKWMQDAIYNQIQVAQNVANTPYQPYSGEQVAPLSQMQQQAYQNVASNQGSWLPSFNAAQSGTQDLTNAGTAGNLAMMQNKYLTGDQSALSTVGQYMNPYQQNVLDTIARQGARNLTENLLPGVSDAFIKAGQFGSSRMGEFGSRALRDTQQAILNQQSTAAQQGYTQALQAAQNQEQYGLSSAQQQQAAQAADYQRQLSALQQLAGLSQQGQGMRTSDVAALEAAGKAQQQQQQAVDTTGYTNWQNEVAYPKNQLDWLNNQVHGVASSVPQTVVNTGSSTGQTYTASPLAQLASAYSTYKGANALGLV
jgi:hypothetical protein